MEILADIVALWFLFKAGQMFRWATGPMQDIAVMNAWHYYFDPVQGARRCAIDGNVRGVGFVLAFIFLPESMLAEALVIHSCLTSAFIMTALSRHELKSKQ